jgi:hypothetical protein
MAGVNNLSVGAIFLYMTSTQTVSFADQAGTLSRSDPVLNRWVGQQIWYINRYAQIALLLMLSYMGRWKDETLGYYHTLYGSRRHSSKSGT